MNTTQVAYLVGAIVVIAIGVYMVKQLVGSVAPAQSYDDLKSRLEGK